LAGAAGGLVVFASVLSSQTRLAAVTLNPSLAPAAAVVVEVPALRSDVDSDVAPALSSVGAGTSVQHLYVARDAGIVYTRQDVTDTDAGALGLEVTRLRDAGAWPALSRST